jgi:hypothetical protein
VARVARTPGGQRWKVRRLWLPRLRQRYELAGGEGFNIASTAAGDSLVALAIIVGAAALALVVAVLLPYVFFALELLVVPALFAYRILLRRPWTVEAITENDRRRWEVVGWRRSGEAVAEIARAIERGELSYRPRDAEPLGRGKA